MLRTHTCPVQHGVATTWSEKIKIKRTKHTSLAHTPVEVQVENLPVSKVEKLQGE